MRWNTISSRLRCSWNSWKIHPPEKQFKETSGRELWDLHAHACMHGCRKCTSVLFMPLGLFLSQEFLVNERKHEHISRCIQGQRCVARPHEGNLFGKVCAAFTSSPEYLRRLNLNWAHERAPAHGSTGEAQALLACLKHGWAFKIFSLSNDQT